MVRYELGAMTIAEAARKGGKKVAEEYGQEFYVEIGRKGGRKICDEYGVGFYEEIGRKGAMVQRQMVADGRAALGERASYKECLAHGKQMRLQLATEIDPTDLRLRRKLAEEGLRVLGVAGTREQCMNVGIAVMKANGSLPKKKGQMTVREAGRKGGESCYERHGYEFYEEIGRKGGCKVRDAYGTEFYEEIGAKGNIVLAGILAAGREALGLTRK